MSAASEAEVLDGSGPGAHLAAAPRQPRRSRLEGPLWLLAGLLLAVVTTWPLSRRLGDVVPQDAGDPLLQAWQAAWGGHALRTQPLNPFEANGFFPATPGLAFSDSLLGFAPFSLVGSGPTAALVRYGLLFLLAYALCFAGAALLGRELGLGVPAAVVVGVAYAWAPWRMAQNGHLNILSTGGVALTLFLLASGYRRNRPWQVVCGWLVAAWQLSIGFALGLWFCYLLLTLAVLAVVVWLVRGRPALPRGLLVATGAGGTALLVVAGLLARPYLDVVSRNPDAVRSLAEIEFFSPPWRSLLTADATSRLWGQTSETLRTTLPWAPEQTLFPGLVVVVLAVVGLRWRGAARPLRVGLAFALGVVLILSLGLSFLDGRLYVPLYDNLPGWDGIRTPGRLAFVWTLLLALLAGMGAQRLADSFRRTTAAAVVLALAAAVLVEGLPRLPLVEPPLPPAALSGLPEPQVHLPSNPAADRAYLWWSTDGFPRIANGDGTYVPPELAAVRNETAGFPDAASVELLRSYGFRTVVVHRAFLAGTPWEQAADRPVDGLDITRSDAGDVVVFDLG